MPGSVGITRIGQAWWLSLLLSLPVAVMAAKLAPCPTTPNCVSSLASDAGHFVEPLRYSGEQAAAKAKLLQLVVRQPRTAVLLDEAAYLHVTFTSRVFGFIDDVEFLFDDQAKLIHVRAASRKGRYDFGVNRRRVDTLRAAYLPE